MAAENTSTAAFSTTEQPGQADKWLVAASVPMGTFLSVMDVSVVNVAMPYMMGSFGQDLLTITLVSTATASLKLL
jgi:MFS transporter, DHA2 family, multidrug resistance protein